MAWILLFISRMRMHMAKLGVLTAIAGVLALRAAPAQACSCALPGSPTDALAQATAVFEGHVLSIRDDATTRTRFVDFQILRAWKGVHADTVVAIATGDNGSSCGIAMPVGSTWLVYANAFEGQLGTGLCSRTAPSADAAADFVELGTASETGDAAPGSLTPGSLGNPGWCALAGDERAPVPGVVMTFALVALALGRRRAARLLRRR